jgi:2-(1,2-epoxy-1,2-dihydrophenyl)acetyl-CoA isomerase
VKPYPEAPEGLLVERDGAVLRIRLNRPERRNAMTDDMVLGLIETLDAAGSDDGVRVISLSAEGANFCSGFDLGQREMSERPRAGSTQRQMRWHVNRLIPAMLEVQLPIVTAATGWIAGLGLNLLLASDFAIVAEDARLWSPFTSAGFTPDSGGSWLLPRLVGVARAKEMILLARPVTGAEAASWGVVHRAVPSPEVNALADDLVGELAGAATVAVGLAKLLIHRSLSSDLNAHLADEALALELASRSEDFKEGRRARVEKRRPDFRGR